MQSLVVATAQRAQDSVAMPKRPAVASAKDRLQIDPGLPNDLAPVPCRVQAQRRPSGKVIAARTSELAIYEGPLNFEIGLEFGAANMSALITAFRYVAFGVRRPAGVCVMSFTPTTPGCL